MLFVPVAPLVFVELLVPEDAFVPESVELVIPVELLLVLVVTPLVVTTLWLALADVPGSFHEFCPVDAV